MHLLVLFLMMNSVGDPVE